MNAKHHRHHRSMPKKRRGTEIRRRVHKVFGARVAEARTERRLLQQELGRRLGVSRTTVSNIECGSQSVSLDQAFHIAQVLEVPIAELLPAMEHVFPASHLHAAADDPLSVQAKEHATRVVETVGEMIKKPASRTA